MKHLSFFILTFLFSFHVKAQYKLHVGGGVNNSDFIFRTDIFSYDNYYEPGIDFFISTRPELAFSKRWFVSTDVQYSQKSYKTVFLSLERKILTRVSYIEFIPQVEYKILSFMGLYGGMGYGIKVSHQEKFNNKWEKAPDDVTKKMNLNYLFGLRFVPFNKWSISAHYATSLNNFFDIEFTNITGQPVETYSRLNNFQLGIAYQIF